MSRYVRYPSTQWLPAVADAASLPADATPGDARVTIDSNSIYIYGLDDAWHQVSGGGGGGGDSFYIMNTPLGTSPTATSATDILSWASSDIDITGDATTDTITLALTNAGVIGKVLTGYSAATGAIAATDTILQAFNKAIASNTATTVTNRLMTWSGVGGHLAQDATTVTALSNSLTATAASAFNISSAADIALFQGSQGTPTIVVTSANTLIGRNDVNSSMTLGSTSAGAGTSTTFDITTTYNNTGVARALSILGGLASPTTSQGGGSLTIRGGHTRATTLVGALPGPLTLSGGDHQNTGVAGPGALITVQGGNSLGSGAGGNALVQGGTSGTGAAGVVQIGRTSTTNKNILNNATSANNAGVLTLTNAPTGVTGNPTGYLLITINGSDRVIPYW